MASPSPKRRKTSEPEPEVSATGDFRPRNALRRTPPRRASYLSPTKATLARFNPEILSRRASAASAIGEPAGPADPPGRGQRALSYVLGETQEQPDRQGGGAVAEQSEAQRRQSIQRILPSRDVLQAAAADQQAHESSERRGDAEDDLPTHPTGSPAGRPDLPPQEALFSSPSKRPKRNRVLGQRLSSPFKPRHSPLSFEPQAKDATTGAEDSPSPRQQVPSTAQEPNVAAEKRIQESAAPKSADQDLNQKEKERLQKQLLELQDEVSQYEREIERSRTAPSHDGAEDLSALISLINKANPEPPASKPEAPPLSSLLTSFLPLAKPIHPPTPPPEEPEKPLATHEPVDLEDPLPYLRLFTSMDYNSRIGIDESGNQLHAISIRSPSSLLHLDFDMAVDPKSQSVSKLAIRSFSPWASHELGTWVTQRAAENDVGGICWATESYLDLSVKRAKTWARCFREFGRLLNEVTDGKNTRNKAKPASKRKADNEIPTSTQDEDAEEVSGIGNDLAVGEADGRPVSRAELLRGLGRDNIVLRSKEVLLRVSWNIQFDWTGEAESVVRVDVALPKVWREADERGSLKKISETFDKLVTEMGVFESVKTMVGLLFG